jgi:DNA-binding XRE family transcriptional regulator
MKNPIKIKREQLQLTQGELASAAGITRQVVVLSEQGLYKSPPESLLRVLCRMDFTSQAVLTANYASWVTSQRWLHRDRFMRVGPGQVTWSALKNQVAGKSQQAFCRELVYQPSLVREFEKYGRGSAGIYAALKECGFDVSQLI